MSALLEVENLNVHFPIMGGVLRRRVGQVFAVNEKRCDTSRKAIARIVMTLSTARPGISPTELNRESAIGLASMTSQP